MPFLPFIISGWLKTDQMMSHESSLHHGVLIVALIVFTQDLNCGGGAKAWTYHYSTSPRREWCDARKWCQENFKDIVTIQTQEENDFIDNLLPRYSKYYWIGFHREAGVWTWEGTNKVVPNEFQNWATGEPDDLKDRDCVEIYIKRNEDRAKWNNEKCQSKKGTICYSDSCTKDSCSVHADCVETVGSYACQCHPGFFGQRCEEAITCNPLPEPEKGSHNCSHPYGPYRFNSSCGFHCELGFRLLGSPQLLCQSSGHWDHPAPLCQVEQCPALKHANISGGAMNCSHPIAPYSYNSTCEIRCDEGYELSGESQMRCDHTGQWTASVPACTLKKCSPILFLDTGNVTCVDTVEPFSFGSWCDFTCQDGYYLTGDSTLTCLASGKWSKPSPTCTVVQCNRLEAPPHAFVKCQGPLGEDNYGSICTVQCEEGFDLMGTNMTKCSSHGNWSHELPVCQAKRCPTRNSPPHGYSSCHGPHGKFTFGSRCTSTCEEGFFLKGQADSECTSQGTWSTDTPQCLANRCPSLSSPPHGYVSCSGPHGEFSFGSQCTFTCADGFVLNGTGDTECTSAGTWSRETANCLARPCPLLAKAPQQGRMTCIHPHSPFSYNSRCGFECNEGFWLRGTPTVTCNHSGDWSQDLPTCQPVQCEAVPALSLPLSVNCSHPLGNFSFGSKCLFTCTGGFSLNGTEVLLCSSSGLWSDSLPNCTALQSGIAMLMKSPVGVAAVVVPLALIGLAGLALFLLKRPKNRGKAIISDVASWEERENPAFES